METEHDIIVDASHRNERLDVFLSHETGLTRSRISKLIDGGLVTVDGKNAKAGYRMKSDDRVFVKVPEAEDLAARPEDIPLDIVYEDRDIIVINKPRGIVVHPSPSHSTHTLVNAILHHSKDLSGIGGRIRPGVVHRLDKDTSGLIVFAKNDAAHLNLAEQIRNRAVKKTYLALVYGRVKADSGMIDEPLGRHPKYRKKMAVIRSAGLKKRSALTYFKVLRRFKDYSLLELDLKTGRTHQIRVHLAYLGHPVVGDETYSKKKDPFGVKGQLLHASRLSFNHPLTGKLMEFSAEMPEEMKRIIASVEDESRDHAEEKGSAHQHEDLR